MRSNAIDREIAGMCAPHVGVKRCPHFDRSQSQLCTFVRAQSAQPTRRVSCWISRRAIVASFPIYLFIFIVFLNRYVFGLYLTLIRKQHLDPKIAGYEPTV